MKPIAEADIGPGGEAEWQRLRRQVELAEGFWLGFIFSPSPLSSGVLRRRTDRLLRAQTRRLEVFQPETPSALKGLLPTLFTPEAASAGCTWVEALHLDPGGGAERPWREAWLELISRMNERRDALRRHLRGGLVLVAPPEMKHSVREAASDLWSIRALVVELPLVAEGSLREFPLNTGSFSERGLSGRGPEAEALTEFALAESERLLGKATGDEPRTMEVLLRRVDALLSSGRTGEAVETARRARELACKDSRGEPRLQATTLHKLALAERAHGDSAAAAEHLEQAVKVLGSRDNRYRALLLDELASLALWRGDLVSALAALEEALSLRWQLRAALGDTPETLRDLSVALTNVGDVQRRLGHLLAASAAFEESLALARQLRASRGDTPETLRDLSVSLDNVGDVQQHLGNLPAASAAFEESLALVRQLRTVLGDTPEVLRDLSVSLANVGDVQRYLGHFPAASTAYAEALPLARQLRVALGDTPQALRALSISLNRVGDVQQRLGHLPAASAAYEEALTLRIQLRAALGDTPEALRDLFVSLNRVGDIQRRMGHLPAASAAYEEALALARQLHKLMGDIPQAFEDLAISLSQVADIRESLGDSDGAALARKEVQALHSRSEE
jgi:tetratricopeptide (TPR) repeat protein